MTHRETNKQASKQEESLLSSFVIHQNTGTTKWMSNNELVDLQLRIASLPVYCSAYLCLGNTLVVVGWSRSSHFWLVEGDCRLRTPEYTMTTKICRTGYSYVIDKFFLLSLDIELSMRFPLWFFLIKVAQS